MLLIMSNCNWMNQRGVEAAHDEKRSEMMTRKIGQAATRIACLVLAALVMASASAYEFVAVGDGETITIGEGVANSSASELSAFAGATIILPAPSAGGVAYVYTRLILKGSGTVTLAAPPDDENYAATVVTIANGVTAADSVTLHVAVPTVTALKVGKTCGEKEANYPIADIKNVTFANPDGIFGLRESVTVKKIPDTYMINPTGDTRLALTGSNPLRLTDSLVLTNFDVVELTSDCIPAACTVHVAPGRNLYVKPCNLQSTSGGQAYSNAWFWGGESKPSGPYAVVLEGKGARVICRNNKDLRLQAAVSGKGEILLRPDTTADIKTAYKGMDYITSPTAFVTIPVDTTSEPEPDDSWQAKVAHWFDASDTDSFVWYDYPNLVTNYNGYPLLIGWKDTKKVISDIYLYNRRMYNGKDTTVSQDVPQVLPYVVSGGLNGMPYVAFSGGSRRLPFHSASTACTGTQAPTGGNIATFNDCPFCIMVFGSQDGGGKAILGDTAQSFTRANATTGSAWMTNSVCKLTVNGREATPTSAKPNGGWQILSVDMSERQYSLSCIGAAHATSTTSYNSSSTGQRYAELIFFAEKPTVKERTACERYLARKWGLESSYDFWDTDSVEITGAGTVNMTDSSKPNHEGVDEITVAGSFTGTINVPAGKTLVVSPRPAPPTVADLPQQENIAAWFDPSLEGAIDFNESGSKPTGVARLYSRTATGVDKSEGTCWMGANTLASATGRFPFLVQTAYSGGFGAAPTIGWMDFEKDSKGSGNTLRSRGIAITNTWSATVTAMPIRSVFMSLDSSAGGGNPFADTVGMTDMFKPRKGSDVKDPIWSPSNTVTMAHTWLGTNEVNGAATGFSGRGEVLGFEFPSQRSMPMYLGFYKGGGNSETNFEHIGETIIYKTALSDAERLTVQEYLMAKWLGDYGSKYSDLAGTTVTGDGVVKSASLRNLPLLDAGFTGSLAGGSALAFTIDREVSTTAAIDALSFDRPVALDTNGTVTVTGAVRPGTYTLLTATSVTGGNGLTLLMEDNRFDAELAIEGTSFVLRVKSSGTMVIFK